MKKIINLFIFALIVSGLLFGIGFVFNNYIEGDFKEYVINEKPTILVLVDGEKQSTYATLNKNMAFIGDKYEEKISISTILVNADSYALIESDFNLKGIAKPSSILLNGTGDVISVYEGSFPVENIIFDLEKLVK